MARYGSISLFFMFEACVYGKEFKVQRLRNGFSLGDVVRAMNAKGWCWYPSKLFRLEKKMRFCLASEEMMDLLDCIKTGFIVKFPLDFF